MIKTRVYEGAHFGMNDGGLSIDIEESLGREGLTIAGAPPATRDFTLKVSLSNMGTRTSMVIPLGNREIVKWLIGALQSTMEEMSPLKGWAPHYVLGSPNLLQGSRGEGDGGHVWEETTPSISRIKGERLAEDKARRENELKWNLKIADWLQAHVKVGDWVDQELVGKEVFPPMEVEQSSPGNFRIRYSPGNVPMVLGLAARFEANERHDGGYSTGRRAKHEFLMTDQLLKLRELVEAEYADPAWDAPPVPPYTQQTHTAGAWTMTVTTGETFTFFHVHCEGVLMTAGTAVVRNGKAAWSAWKRHGLKGVPPELLAIEPPFPPSFQGLPEEG